jgi:cytochrome c556
MKYINRLTLVGVVVMFAVIASAMAHEHAVGVIKDRMDGMMSMAKSMKVIKQRIRANQSPHAIALEAKNVQTQALAIISFFPPGSTQPPTDARPEVWKNWADFEAKAKALKTESNKLAGMGAESLPNINAQYAVVARTCSNCHELYRSKN